MDEKQYITNVGLLWPLSRNFTRQLRPDHELVPHWLALTNQKYYHLKLLDQRSGTIANSGQNENLLSP